MPGDLIDEDEIDWEELFAPLIDRRGVGLAVSGGPDSLALMLLVDRWRRNRDTAPPIFVYSVDHALRPESADEVRRVLTHAQELGLPARALRWDGEKPKTHLHASAREARYRLMREAMARDGADLLLTGHHLHDQAETILMRLAHFSGVKGLRGMKRLALVEGVEVYRPLLGIIPSALRDVVRDAGVEPVDDPSNHNPAFERVRWRRLLPALSEAGLDPGVIAFFGRRMEVVDEMIEDGAAKARAEIWYADTDRVTLQHGPFLALPEPVAVRLLGEALADVGGADKKRAQTEIEALHFLLTVKPALKRTSLHGCLVSSDGVTIVVAREAGRKAARQSRVRPDSSVTRN